MRAHNAKLLLVVIQLCPLQLFSICVKAFPPRIMTNAGVALQQRSLRPAFPVYIFDSALGAHDPDGMALWALA
jgi:hypothetical protein